MSAEEHGIVPSDSRLIRRFLRGDEHAFRVLHARHSPRLRAVLRRVLGRDNDDLDDIVQDTWLASCRAMPSYRGESAFFTWLATVGIRAAYRRALREDPAGAPNADDLEAPPSPDPLAAVDLERALAKLPARERAVVILHDVEGFNHDEIAVQLDVAAGTSRNTLMRARATLRRLLTAAEAYV